MNSRPKHVWFQINETECFLLWLVRGRSIRLSFCDITVMALWPRGLSSFDFKYNEKKNTWVFASNSGFLIAISSQPKVAYLRYFKLWILLNQLVQVWNIKGWKDIGIIKFDIVASTQFICFSIISSENFCFSKFIFI